MQQVRIPARQRRRLDLTLRPTRRGDRRAGPVVIRALGPLRVAGRQVEHDAPWTVRALPPFSARKHLPSRLARLRELDGRATILQRGQGTEFDSLREYVPGDDVRSIDWRGTARSTHGGRADLAAGARPPRADRAGLGPDLGRPGR